MKSFRLYKGKIIKVIELSSKRGDSSSKRGDSSSIMNLTISYIVAQMENMNLPKKKNEKV